MLEKEILKFFSHNVGKLSLGRDVFGGNSSANDLISYKMAIRTYIFCASMIDGIRRYNDGR